MNLKIMLFLNAVLICCLVISNGDANLNENSDNEKIVDNNDAIAPQIQIKVRTFSNEAEKNERQAALHQSSLDHSNTDPNDNLYTTATVAVDYQNEKEQASTESSLEIFNSDSLLSTSVRDLSSIVSQVWNYVTVADHTTENPERKEDLPSFDKTEKVEMSQTNEILDSFVEEKDVSITSATRYDNLKMTDRNEPIIQTKEKDNTNMRKENSQHRGNKFRKHSGKSRKQISNNEPLSGSSSHSDKTTQKNKSSKTVHSGQTTHERAKTFRKPNTDEWNWPDVDATLTDDRVYNDDGTVLGNDNSGDLSDYALLSKFAWLIGGSDNKQQVTPANLAADTSLNLDVGSTSALDDPYESSGRVDGSFYRNGIPGRSPIEADLASSDISKVAQRYETCDACMIVPSTSSRECPQYRDAVNEFDIWARALSEQLRYGCSRPGGHQDKRCCHAQDSTVGSAIYQMQKAVKSLTVVLSKQCNKCPVDCTLSEWSSWSNCPATCGDTGSRNRTRQRRLEKYSGKTCVGELEQKEECPQLPIEEGQWMLWTDWSACSSKCGGTTHRTRKCSKTNDCKTDCKGDCFQIKKCGECCQPATWGPWTSWTECLGTNKSLDIETGKQCGIGCKKRERECHPGNCPNQTCFGDHVERMLCKLDPCCAVPVWGDWCEWSACSVSSGSGLRSRSRTCQADPKQWRRPSCHARGCYGQHSQETGSCGGVCAVCEDRVWGSWGSWSVCDFNQRRPRRTSRRECRPNMVWDPRCRHLVCQGQDTKEEECLCEEPEWSQWSPWATCDFTKIPSVRTRSRWCPPIDNPLYCPERSCPGTSEQSVTCCGSQQWMQWGEWTRCERRGDQLRRSRTRICSGPDPGCPNRNCDGRSMDTEDCPNPNPNPITTEQPCDPGQWSSWTPWSKCDCRQRKQSRSRNRIRRLGSSVHLCHPYEEIEDQGCDDDCHECQETCAGRKDDKYPSRCKKGCKGFITCCDGVAFDEECRGDQQYNSVCKECQKSPSPTCESGQQDKYMMVIDFSTVEKCPNPAKQAIETGSGL